MVPGMCSFWVLVCSVLDNYSASDRWAKYCDEHVCLCVCVCLSAMISWELHVWSLPNFWHMLPMAVARFSWQRSDTLCISGFMDGVIFAHKLRLLDVATRLRQWGLHAASGLARRNTRCRQQTFETTSTRRTMGVFNIYDIMFAHNVAAYFAARNSPGGNTGGGVCGLWMLCLTFDVVSLLVSNGDQDGIPSQKNLQFPWNGCQIVCSSVGTVNYKYIRETFF